MATKEGWVRISAENKLKADKRIAVGQFHRRLMQ